MKFQMPVETKVAISAAQALIAHRRDVDRVDAELDQQARIAASEAARAAEGFDTIESELALADAEGDEVRFAALTKECEQQREAGGKARAEVERIARARRGLVTRRAAIDDEIEAADSGVAAALQCIREAALLAWREDLRRAVAELAEVLRAGHAIRDALNVPDRGLLDEISIRDPASGPSPVRRLIIDGRLNYSAAAGGEFIDEPEDLRSTWRGVPELRALNELLAPLGAIEREVTSIAGRVRARKDLERRAAAAAERAAHPRHSAAYSFTIRRVE
jgi:hypothetical protein